MFHVKHFDKKTLAASIPIGINEASELFLIANVSRETFFI